MLIHKKSDIIPSEITSKENFENRRTLIKAAGASLLTQAAFSQDLLAVLPMLLQADKKSILTQNLNMVQKRN